MLAGRPLPSTLSPCAGRFLAAKRARRVPSLTTDREALIVLLAERQLPAHEPVLALEEQLGGFEAEWLQLGAYRMLKKSDEHASFAHREDESGQPLVLIGRDADSMLYMDREGAIFAEALGHHAIVRRADGPLRIIEKAALLHEASDPRRFPLRCDVQSRDGQTIADAVGASGDPHASDDVQSFWRADGLVIGEGQLFERPQDPADPRLTLIASNVGVLVSSLRATDPSVRARVLSTPVATRLLPVESAAAPETKGSTSRREYWPRTPREHGYLLIRDDAGEPAIDQVLLCGDRVIQTERFIGRSGTRESFTSASSALGGVVSERAQRFLDRVGGSFDPRERLDGGALTALLRHNHLPLFVSVLRFEDQFGGLTFTRDDEHSFGVAWELGGAAPTPPQRLEGRLLLPVGRHGDFLYFLDERGFLYEKHWDGSPELIADSLPDLLDDMASRDADDE